MFLRIVLIFDWLQLRKISRWFFLSRNFESMWSFPRVFQSLRTATSHLQILNSTSNGTTRKMTGMSNDFRSTAVGFNDVVGMITYSFHKSESYTAKTMRMSKHRRISLRELSQVAHNFWILSFLWAKCVVCKSVNVVVLCTTARRWWFLRWCRYSPAAQESLFLRSRLRRD